MSYIDGGEMQMAQLSCNADILRKLPAIALLLNGTLAATAGGLHSPDPANARCALAPASELAEGGSEPCNLIFTWFCVVSVWLLADLRRLCVGVVE